MRRSTRRCRDGARAVVWPLVLFAVAACSDGPPDADTAPVPADRNAVTLEQRPSGYTGSPAQWRGFIDCWARDVQGARPDAVPLVEAGAVVVDDVALESAIQQRQRQLGVELPRSYLDFLRAYRPRGQWSTVANATGFLAPEAIDTVARLDPEGVALAQQFPLEPDDATYFRYGIEQDSATARSRYQAGAIIVGKYGSSLYEQILLFPQVRTRDGEMEAALLGWSGTFRAPSFAELMRQLHYLDLGRAVHVPPYAQTLLRGTCADAMPLQDVWWK